MNPNQMLVGEARLAHLALALLVEPGNRDLGQLVRKYHPQEVLGRLLRSEAPTFLCEAVATRLASWGQGTDSRQVLDLARKAVVQAERIGARIVLPGDPQWPDRLGDLVRISRSAGSIVDLNTDPPLCFWVLGDLALGEVLERSVAVVGARAASGYGAQTAADLAYELSNRGWTVVSGGAFGIDAAAHRGCLAAGGPTVAVLANGVERPYPAAHASLLASVAESGLVISEWPPGSAPHRHRFLLRNRVIAAATLGTVMVEAAARSGARQTLGRARLLGRPVMVVPGPVTSAMSVGCHQELRSPETRLVTSAAEVVEEVGRIGELAPIPQGELRRHDALDPIGLQVLDAVPASSGHTAEEIAAAAGVGSRQARRELPKLVAAGLVIAEKTGYRLAQQRMIGS